MMRLAGLAGALLLLGSPQARAATRSYGATSFDRLIVTGPFDVSVKVGPGATVRADGAQDAIARLSVEQQGNTLVVKPLPGGWGGWPQGDHGRVAIAITTPSLTQASLTGSGGMTIDRVRGDDLDLRLAGSGSLSVGTIDVVKLRAASNGSGTMTLTGKAWQGQLFLAGTGNIVADTLTVKFLAEATLNGSGDLSLGAVNKAKLTLSGPGNLRITGPASCEVQQSGSGTVSCAHRVTAAGQEQP